MRNKIKEALKTKYVNLGLGEKAFDGVSAFLEKTIKDESEIATFIEGAEVKGLLTAIQGEGDKSRQEKATLLQQFEAYKMENPVTKPVSDNLPTPPAAVGGLTSQMIKEIFDQSAKDMLAPLQEKLATLEQSRVKENTLSQAIFMRDALKLDAKYKTWAEDAWSSATTSIAEADTPAVIVDRFKVRYDEYMSRLGAKGYVPADGSGGGTDKSSTARLVEEIVKKDAEKSTSAQSVSERFKVGQPSV